ncbi:MAG: alpha-L-rhamnosidase N-terminal domain-containing protein, partial [Anaerolineae bacterium]
VRSQPRRMHYDLFDLAPYLRAGENVIAVHVKYYGVARSFWMPAVPTMTLGKTGVLVFEADLGAGNWLVSDATWKAMQSDAWDQPPPGWGPGGGGIPIEILDARRLPHGWEQPGFDDAAWGNAVVVPSIYFGGYAHSRPPTSPYGPLYPRPIAKLGGETLAPIGVRVETLAGAVALDEAHPGMRLHRSLQATVTASRQSAGLPVPFEIPADGAVRVVLDFGRIVSGFVQFEIAAPAGTVLDFCFVEDPMTERLGFGGPHSGARYIARGANDVCRLFDSNGLRHVYLLAHGAGGPATLKSLSVREHIYPWTSGAAFACSDEELNRIFRAGIRTVQLNSHDAFLDCPTREQRAWVGDSVVHQMVHLATNCDWRLAWRYLDVANSPRYDGILPMSVAGDIEWGGGETIPDWALHWVHGVYNFYRFAGDRKALTAFMPTVARVLRWYEPYQTRQGVLKDVTEWNLIDWASVMNEDCSALITALWCRGLREFAEMAGWLGENASREWAEEAYARAKAGFEIFWDEARGSYVDHVVNGVRHPAMSQMGGAFAIVSGLAPRERWRRIIETITDPAKLVVRSWTGGGGDYSAEKMMKQMRGIYEPDWDVEREIVMGEPFISYVVHDAVAAAGMADRLPDLYRKWSEFLVNGYDTIGECWGWGTHVHGWSCTPTKDMIFYTLGVTPAEPGYTRARIAPRLGRLAWAEGKVPTPHGLIHVRAEPDKVAIDSPVPVIVDLSGHAPRGLPAGQHEVAA